MTFELPKVGWKENPLVQGLVIALGWLLVYWLGFFSCYFLGKV